MSGVILLDEGDVDAKPGGKENKSDRTLCEPGIQPQDEIPVASVVTILKDLMVSATAGKAKQTPNAASLRPIRVLVIQVEAVTLAARVRSGTMLIGARHGEFQSVCGWVG